MWTAAEPLDHTGEFYRFAKAFSEVKLLQAGGIPTYFGGASGAAATVAAKQHRDAYALWGEPLAAVKQRIADIHEKAAAFGRLLRISVSLRPIIAPTEAQAWERARRILAEVMEARPSVVGEGAGMRPQAVGARRLVDFASEAEVHDKRLWTPIAAAMGAPAESPRSWAPRSRWPSPCSTHHDIGGTTLLDPASIRRTTCSTTVAS